MEGGLLLDQVIWLRAYKRCRVRRSRSILIEALDFGDFTGKRLDEMVFWHHFGGMNITLKEVPADLHARIKEAADQSGRSINRQIIFILEKTLFPVKSSREDLLARIRKRRGRMGGMIDDQFMQSAIEGDRS